MSLLDLQTIVEKNEDILSSPVDEETVLLSIEDSSYYGIDPVGTSIWNLLDSPRSVKEIVTALLAVYDVDEEKCKSDVLSFLKILIKKNIIQLHSD